MSLARRYRWELAPLLIAASAVWAVPLLPGGIAFVLSLWHLGMAALLAVGVVRVSRLGRPLLTVLWAVMLVRLLAPAANYSGIAVRHSLGQGPVGFGLLLTLIQVAVVAVVVWLAWRQGAGGRRYAMLVCAGYLVPGFTARFGSLKPDLGSAVLVLAAASLALHLASLAAIAVAFGRFEELLAERQRRVVAWLLALPLAAAVLRGLLLVVELAAENPDDPPLSFMPASLLPLVMYAGTAGVLLGLTWLATLAPLAARAKTRRCVAWCSPDTCSLPLGDRTASMGVPG